MMGLKEPDDLISCFLRFDYRIVIVEDCPLFVSGSLDRSKRRELVSTEKTFNRLDSTVSAFLSLNCHRDRDGFSFLQER
jgi:hypothetical protein